MSTIQETGLCAIRHFPAGSFAVQFGDHFWSGDHLRRCTDHFMDLK